MSTLIMKNKMAILKTQLQQLSMSILLLTSMLFSSTVLAVDIAKSPLFLGKGIPPNVLFVLDDSGSMDWEILTVPHFEAWNYDRDLNRSWASGGWLKASGSDRRRDKVEDGSWTSYAGYCKDRNADGICYNEQDYDNDDNKTGEHGSVDVMGGGTPATCTSCTAIHNSTYTKFHNKRYRKREAECKLKEVSGTDASKYLPAPTNVVQLKHSIPLLDNGNVVTTTIQLAAEKPVNFADWLAKLTGSADAMATPGHMGCSNTVVCANGLDNNPSNTSPNDDDGDESKRKYRYKDHSAETVVWVTGLTATAFAATEASCEANTDYEWSRTNYEWFDAPNSDDWSEIVPASVSINDHFTGGTPDTVQSTEPALDINGNNAYNNSGFHEKDQIGTARIDFYYLNEFRDNVFLNPNGPWNGGSATWRTCSQSNKIYNAAFRCNHLINADYATNYPYSATTPTAAATHNYSGNQAILTLPSSLTQQNRNLPAQSYAWDQLYPVNTFAAVAWAPWVGGGPKPASYPPSIPMGGPSPAGTHHAMGEFDPWPLIVDWRPRSADFNVIYYNPTSVYEPWPSPPFGDPNHLADADFTAVRSNPQPGTLGNGAEIAHDYFDTGVKVATINLAKPHGANGTSEGGFIYEIWHDDAGFWGSKPEWFNSSVCGDGSTGWKATSTGSAFVAGTLNNSGNGQGVTDPATGHVVANNERVCSKYKDQPNGMVDLWDKHDRVEVYLNKIVVKTVRRTPHIMGEKYTSTNDAKYALMSDTRILNTETYEPANYAAYSTDAFCRATLGDDPDNPGHCRTVAQVQQNVANWFEYSRRRSFVAKGAIAKVIEKLPNLRYGLNVTAATGDVSKLFVEIPAAGPYEAHNAALTQSLYNFAWQEEGTPLRKALQRAGKYFKGELAAEGYDSPIIESCQKNYSVLLTDGYWNGFNPADTNDQDGDTIDNTLADVAKKYYKEDLSTLPNDVPSSGIFNTNNQQHMTTIGVAFGVVGKLTADASGAWPALALDASGGLDGSNWGDPTIDTNLAEKIDDLWHAAYNSRGSYLNAKTPKELVNKLIAAISNIDSEAGSGSALSVNSNVLKEDGSTRVYQTLFTSGEWSGDVKSYTISTSGLVNPVHEWSAQAELNAVSAAAREIFTLGINNEGIPFQWADLVDASEATAAVPDQQLAMKKVWPSGAVQSDTFGENQVDYIRGEEFPGLFRGRSSKLGDIVHSAPLYVSVPSQLYTDASYLTFKTTHNTRNPMLYVGANDGMLHAFDAADGKEKYAYIPRVLIPKLNSLSHLETTTQAFQHEYFVDDTPVSGDVQFTDNSWHTVLVGGLRGGGKGIYALDVTTIPANAESSADTLALWEFTDTDDIDMGYSFSRPSIIRLNNGKFGAVFGNGYNSGAEKAVIYIVEFDTDTEFGTVHKFETAVGDSANSNGMSTPTAIDIDGDMVADRIYAGDLLGNVWVIDISDASDTNWKFSFNSQLQSNDPLVVKTPLFTAINDDGDAQAITAPIVVSEHPLGPVAGYILNFGTGQYLGSSDNSSTGQEDQTMYGLWDYDRSGITRADLLEQEILADLVHTASNTAVRVTSDNGAPQWMNVGHLLGDANWQDNVKEKGWYMDLENLAGENKGERVISPMVVRGGAIILSTLLPAGDPCSGGGSGWIMTLNAATGARFNVSPFDINGDGLFTNDDFADLNGTDTAVSGVRSDSGIPSTPIMLSVPGGGTIALSDNSSAGLAFDSTATAEFTSCSVVGDGTCTVEPGLNPGDPAVCVLSDPAASCYMGGHCAAGACLGFNFSDIGRQSWIQIE